MSQTESTVSQNETKNERVSGAESEKRDRSVSESNKSESKTVSRKAYIIEREGNKIKRMIPLPEEKKKEGSNSWIWGVLTIIGIIFILVIIFKYFGNRGIINESRGVNAGNGEE